MRFAVPLAAALLLSTACTRAYTDVTPQGTVVTRESYPQWETVRRKKDIGLPLAVRQRFEAYYRAKGYWPHSLQAWLEADSDNRLHLAGLHRSGFALLDIVRATPDTLPLEFEFRTRTNWRFSRDDSGLATGRDVHGRFLFVHHPDGRITVQQQVDKPAQGSTLAPVQARR